MRTGAPRRVPCSTVSPLALPFLILTLLVSVVTFAAYGIDKRRARRGARRIPERTLQGLAAAGGWVGALAGRRVFHHKTRKRTFSLGLYAIAAMHVVLWAYLLTR